MSSHNKFANQQKFNLWYKLMISTVFFILTLFNPTKGQNTEKDEIQFDNAKYGYIFQKQNITIMSGDVEFRHKNTNFYCDSLYRTKQIVKAYGNIVLHQGDTLIIHGDSLHYNSITGQCDIYSKVSLQKGSKSVYTEKMRYNVKTKIASYEEGGEVTDGLTWIKSNFGIYNTNNEDVELNGDVFVNSDDYNVKSKKLKYNMKSTIVNFLGPTLIEQKDGSKIYCEQGFFNIKNEKGEFIGNAQFKRNEEKAISNKIFYDGKNRIYKLLGDAHFSDSTRIAIGNQIVIHANEERYEISGNAFYQDTSQTFEGDNINLDKKNGTFSSKGRSTIKNKDFNLVADANNFSNITGKGVSKGRVIFQDKKNKTTLWAENLVSDQKSQFFKASGENVLVKIIQGKDSIYFSSDTLSSNVLLDSLSGDSIRVIKAFHQVKIFSNKIQGIADSAYASTSDSLLTLFGHPKLWSDTTTQFIGDTLKIHFEESQLSKISMLQNSLLLSTEDGNYFNQVGGKYMDVFFKDSVLTKVSVNENAQTVFYDVNNKNEYTGVNTYDCSYFIVFFKENKVDIVKFYGQNNGKYYPFQKANHAKIQLPNFGWHTALRPRNIFDLKKISIEDLNQQF